MKQFSSIFLNSSIASKLISYFFLVILIPTITITSVGNLIYKNSMNVEQNENTAQMARQISNNIDFYIKDKETIINYLSKDTRILKFLNYDGKNQSISMNMIQDEASVAITSFTSLHPEIAGIMIVNPNDMFVSDIMGRISRDPLTDEKWYVQAKQNPMKMQLFSKPVGRNINNIFQYSADNVVSMSKAVIDTNTGKCIGVILIDMKLDIIKGIIENVKPGKTGFVYIVDHYGEIVYSPISAIVYRIKEEWLENMDAKVMVKTIKNKKYEILHANSSYTGWKTVGVFPLDESLKVINSIMYYSIGIAVFTLILAGILAVFFTKSIVNPITKLRALMKKTETGNLDVYFNSKSNDEIGELGNNFNTMIREIKNLIDLVQVEAKNKRKAEIGILQAQIKPHFLYNTLDTIQWMAQEHKAEDIVEIVSALTNLLRVVLSRGEEIIPVRAELQHVESYLIIQKIRYEDKLEYEINFEEDMLECMVTKLILQPMVENAIYHGIKEKRGKGCIQISGKIIDGDLHFIISDNGKGIEADKLNQINDMLINGTGKYGKMGYGVFNVNERIRLSYGEKYGIKFTSVVNEGTKVEIVHPKIN